MASPRSSSSPSKSFQVQGEGGTVHSVSQDEMQKLVRSRIQQARSSAAGMISSRQKIRTPRSPKSPPLNQQDASGTCSSGEKPLVLNDHDDDDDDDERREPMAKTEGNLSSCDFRHEFEEERQDVEEGRDRFALEERDGVAVKTEAEGTRRMSQEQMSDFVRSKIQMARMNMVMNHEPPLPPLTLPLDSLPSSPPNHQAPPTTTPGASPAARNSRENKSEFDDNVVGLTSEKRFSWSSVEGDSSDEASSSDVEGSTAKIRVKVKQDFVPSKKSNAPQGQQHSPSLQRDSPRPESLNGSRQRPPAELGDKFVHNGHSSPRPRRMSHETDTSSPRFGSANISPRRSLVIDDNGEKSSSATRSNISPRRALFVDTSIDTKAGRAWSTTRANISPRRSSFVDARAQQQRASSTSRTKPEMVVHFPGSTKNRKTNTSPSLASHRESNMGLSPQQRASFAKLPFESRTSLDSQNARNTSSSGKNRESLFRLSLEKAENLASESMGEILREAERSAAKQTYFRVATPQGESKTLSKAEIDLYVKDSVQRAQESAKTEIKSMVSESMQKAKETAQEEIREMVRDSISRAKQRVRADIASVGSETPGDIAFEQGEAQREKDEFSATADAQEESTPLVQLETTADENEEKKLSSPCSRTESVASSPTRRRNVRYFSPSPVYMYKRTDRSKDDVGNGKGGQNQQEEIKNSQPTPNSKPSWLRLRGVSMVSGRRDAEDPPTIRGDPPEGRNIWPSFPPRPQNDSFQPDESYATPRQEAMNGCLSQETMFESAVSMHEKMSETESFYDTHMNRSETSDSPETVDGDRKLLEYAEATAGVDMLLQNNNLSEPEKKDMASSTIMAQEGAEAGASAEIPNELCLQNDVEPPGPEIPEVPQSSSEGESYAHDSSPTANFNFSVDDERAAEKIPGEVHVSPQKQSQIQVEEATGESTSALETHTDIQKSPKLSLEMMTPRSQEIDATPPKVANQEEIESFKGEEIISPPFVDQFSEQREQPEKTVPLVFDEGLGTPRDIAEGYGYRFAQSPTSLTYKGGLLVPENLDETTSVAASIAASAVSAPPQYYQANTPYPVTPTKRLAAIPRDDIGEPQQQHYDSLLSSLQQDTGNIHEENMVDFPKEPSSGPSLSGVGASNHAVLPRASVDEPCPREDARDIYSSRTVESAAGESIAAESVSGRTSAADRKPKRPARPTLKQQPKQPHKQPPKQKHRLRQKPPPKPMQSPRQETPRGRSVTRRPRHTVEGQISPERDDQSTCINHKEYTMDTMTFCTSLLGVKEEDEISEDNSLVTKESWITKDEREEAIPMPSPVRRIEHSPNEGATSPTVWMGRFSDNLDHVADRFNETVGVAVLGRSDSASDTETVIQREKEFQQVGSFTFSQGMMTEMASVQAGGSDESEDEISPPPSRRRSSRKRSGVCVLM